VDQAMRGRNVLFICGGIGLVPVRSAIHYVLDHRDEYGDVAVLFGTRRPADRLFTEELRELDERDDVDFQETVDVADPSWNGNVGVITRLIPDVLPDSENTIAVICGPPIMYRFVLRELRKLRLPSRNLYVSLERRMKCAVGKCGHCQIDGVYACQDGPVFNYAEIASLREAL
jgi:NAD(P)H-flavin reductase